jgi:hypothetical protein
MREIETRGGGVYGGGAEVHGPGPGRARPGWAGLGHTAGRNPMARTTTDRNQIRKTKYEMRLRNTRD